MFDRLTLRGRRTHFNPSARHVDVSYPRAAVREVLVIRTRVFQAFNDLEGVVPGWDTHGPRNEAYITALHQRVDCTARQFQTLTSERFPVVHMYFQIFSMLLVSVCMPLT